MTSRALQRWGWVHRWTSLVVTLFMLVLCLTGLPLVFRDELEAWFRPRTQAVASAGMGVTEPLSLDAIVQRGEQARPGERVQFMYWDQERPHVAGVATAATTGAALEDVHRLAFDDRTGAVLQEDEGSVPFLDLMLELHRNLCVGLVGDAVLGLMALTFLASLISGFVLFSPIAARVGFGVVRRGRSRRIYWLDLHNLLGGTTVMWALAVGFSGFVNTLEAPLFAAWDRATIPALLASRGGGTLTPPFASVATVASTARAALPEMEPTSIGFPGSRFGTPVHFLVWMHGTSPLTSHLFTPVLIDGRTGVLAAARPLPWHLRALELSRPLHFGDYGGLPLKIMWGLLDVVTIVVLGTGLWLWVWRRRPSTAATDASRVDESPARPERGPERDVTVSARVPRDSRATLRALRVPLALAGLMGGGLLTALVVGTLPAQTLAWVALAVPLALCGAYWVRGVAWRR